MITKLNNPTTEQLDEILTIWLTANLDAHDFVEPKYWQDNYDLVKQTLPDAELYVATEDHQIVAFLGLAENYIAGLFVNKQYRSRGLGTDLLNAVKKQQQFLQLSVYEKNSRAINFYLNNGFTPKTSDVDFKTNEVECLMTWQTPSPDML